MRRISKIFASAMAFALTVTLVAPTANAVYFDTNRSGTQTYDSTTNTMTSTTTSYTQTNKITGATYSYDYATGTGTGDEDEARKAYHVGINTNVIIGTDSYAAYNIPLEYGEEMTGSIKIKSGKANITLTKTGLYETSDYPNWDGDAKQFYFFKNDGTKLYVGAAGIEYTSDARLALKKTRYTYRYRIFGKKPGVAKLQFKFKDTTGKTVTKNVKVTVSDDARVFKSVTYAGKSLQLDYNRNASNSKVLYCQTSNKDGISYTTKKSGKFKVKMGKNYKFVTAYVITDSDYVTVTDNDEYHSSTRLSRRATGGIDLNKDGDTLDTINGIDESDYDRNNVKVIKNGAKITLGKSANRTDSNSTWTWGNNKEFSEAEKSTFTGNTATTQVIVVYQNKINKSFENESFWLTLRTSK